MMEDFDVEKLIDSDLLDINSDSDSDLDNEQFN